MGREMLDHGALDAIRRGVGRLAAMIPRARAAVVPPKAAAANPRHSWRWQVIRSKVLPKRGARPCWLCGAPATEVDHVVPLASGGTDDLVNLRPSCLPCNRSKGAKSVTEWREAQRPRPRGYGSRTERPRLGIRPDYTARIW